MNLREKVQGGRNFSKNYYSGLKSTYLDYRINKIPLFWDWKISKILLYCNRGKVLDIGCAFGYFLDRLPNSFEKCGIDISSFAINEAKKRFNYEFFVWDIKEPFNYKDLDLVTAFDCIEHISELEHSLNNIMSMLKKDGIFVMGVPLKGSLSATRDPTHIHILSKYEWIRILELAEFEVLDTYSKFAVGTLFVCQKIHQQPASSNPQKINESRVDEYAKSA